MKYLTLAIAMVVLVTASAVQAGTKPPIYSRFRVLLTNGERLRGKTGVFQNDSLIGKSLTGATLIVPVNNIRAMDRYVGNKAEEGGLIGGCVGFLFGYAVCRATEAHVEGSLSSRVNENAVVPVMLGCMAAGALSGALIGASVEKWEEVPVPKPIVSISHNGGKVVFTLAF